MSGDLKWNKIFGAGLGTAFAILVVQQVSQAVYTTEAPEKAGYAVTVAEPTEGGEAAELAPDWGTLIPVADQAAGEAAFARCQGCHSVASGGPDGIGPNLYGVVGGPVMHRAGFAYSDAMAAHKAEAPTWGLDELDQFITAPSRYVPGTKMSFAGLRDTTARVNLIAYLRSQGSTAFPVPAPDPTRQPGGAAPAAALAEGTAPAVEGAEPVDGAAAAAPAAGAPAPAAPAAATAPAAPTA